MNNINQYKGTDLRPIDVSDAYPLPVTIGGSSDFAVDIWGKPVSSLPVSLFHGLWTFDIPQTMWLVYEDDTEVAPASVTGCVSSGGAAYLDTGAGGAGTFSSVLLTSKRHPRYQPNRGHHFATALLCPDAGNDGTAEWGLFNDNAGTIENGVFFRLEADGTLSAVINSGGSETYSQTIDTSSLTGFDVTKGNLYDIRFQWRGMGDYFWYINQTLVHQTSLLGARTALSIENPAMAASYKVTNTTADQSLTIGCVDVTSEGGITAREQYGSATGQGSGNQTDYPIISVYNPPLIGSDTNTRDLRLAKVTASSTAKCTISVWSTRNLAALTGESFAAIGNGSYVQVDTTATAMVTGNAKLLTKFNVEANAADRASNPSEGTIDYYVTRGDIIIVSYTGNATVDVVVEWGEEI